MSEFCVCCGAEIKEYMEKHPPVLHKEKEQEPVR